MTLNVPVRPLEADQVPLIAVPAEGDVNVMTVPVQSDPRAVNWPEVTPQFPEIAQ